MRQFAFVPEADIAGIEIIPAIEDGFDFSF